MFELIIHPNERITKDLFLDSVAWYNEKCHKPVALRILDVEQCPVRDCINIYFEIRQHNWKCRAWHYDNSVLDFGKWEIVNATGETIKYEVELEPAKPGETNIMKIEKNHELFNLMNYTLIERGKLQQGNKQGFKININHICSNLKNLDFKACAKMNDNRKLELVPYIKEFKKL